MKRISSFALAAVLLMFSASLVMAQGGAAPASGTAAAKPAPKPAASAVTKAKTSATGAATAAKGAASASAAAAASMVDINSASKADLMKLPGIGDAISDKIIKGRPFANKAQLVSRGILGQKAYDKISGMVVAKQQMKK